MEAEQFQINLSYVTGIIYIVCFGWQCSIPRYILNCSERLLEALVFVILCSNQIIQLVQNPTWSSDSDDNNNSRKLFNECTSALCYLDNIASCFQTWFIIWIWIPQSPIHRNMKITIIMGFFAQLLLLITFMNRKFDNVAPIVIIPDIFAWLIGTTWLLQNREINSLRRTVTERIEGRCCLRTNEDTLRNLICSWPLFTIALFLESAVIIENLNDVFHQFAVSVLCLAIVISLYMKTYYSLETTALYTRSFNFSSSSSSSSVFGRIFPNSSIGYSNLPHTENEDQEVADVELTTSNRSDRGNRRDGRDRGLDPNKLGVIVNADNGTILENEENGDDESISHNKKEKTQEEYLPRQLQLERRKTEKEQKYNDRLNAFNVQTQVIYPTWINLNAFKSLDELLHYQTQTSLAEWLLFLEEGLPDNNNRSKSESVDLELLTVPLDKISIGSTSASPSTTLASLIVEKDEKGEKEEKEEKEKKEKKEQVSLQIHVQSPDYSSIGNKSNDSKNKHKSKSQVFDSLRRAMRNYIVLQPNDSKNNEYYLGMVSDAIELLTNDKSKISSACNWLDKSTKKYIHERFCMTMLSDTISFGDALTWLRESNSDDDKTLQDDFEHDLKIRQTLSEFYSQCILSSLITHGYVHTMRLYSNKIESEWSAILKLHSEKILETTMGRKQAMKIRRDLQEVALRKPRFPNHPFEETNEETKAS